MRVRVRFCKLGKLRWTSHRDVARLWERALRRAGLTVAYSQGFSPRPRLSFGLALPTGAESLAEYLDVELAAGGPADPGGLPDRLTPLLPAGVAATAARTLEDGSPSLQAEVTSCSWEIGVAGLAPGELADRAAAAWAAPTLVVRRERKGSWSSEDVRPAVLALDAAAGPLRCELATVGRTLRPSELLAALGVAPAAASVCRISQWIERDGARWEPVSLPAGATAAPHAAERAS